MENTTGTIPKAVLLALMATCMITANVYAQSFKLMTYCNDAACTIPRSNEPYSLLRNGIPAGKGVTNTNGQVYTRQHQPGTREDWVVKFINEEYGVRISGDNHREVFLLYTSAKQNGQHIYNRDYFSLSSHADALQRPYYWFELYSADKEWTGQYYEISSDGNLLSKGSTGSDGFIFLRTTAIKENHPFQLRVCGTVFIITLLPGKQDEFSIRYAGTEIINTQTTADSSCNTVSATNAFNLGRPLLHAGIGYGKIWLEELAERAKEDSMEKQSKAREIEDYRNGLTRLSSDAEIAPKGKFPDDILGTFGVHAHPATAQITSLCKELLHPDYQPGHPAFRIFKKDSSYYWKGLITGQERKIDLEMIPMMTDTTNLQERDTAGKIAAGSYDSTRYYSINAVCNESVQVVCFNYNYKEWTDDRLREFAAGCQRPIGLIPSIEDLRKTHYFLIYIISSIGTYSAVFMIPLVRMAQ